MAGRRPQRIGSVPVLGVTQVDDPQTARAFEETSAAIQRLQRARSREAMIVDLEIGTNKLQHSLGRAALGYTLTPTTADATFAHAIDVSNPRPDLEVWVTVIGVAQAGARVEVW